MGDAVIVSAARTAIGTARKGTLLDVDGLRPGQVSRSGEALKRSGIPGDDVDDLQMGEVAPGRRRHRPLRRGRARPRSTSRASRYNRHCASGMAAVQGAAASITAGMDKVVIAGGAESISTLAVRR